MRDKFSKKYIYIFVGVIVAIVFQLNTRPVNAANDCLLIGMCNTANFGETNGCGPLEMCESNGTGFGTCVYNPTACVTCPGLLNSTCTDGVCLGGLEQCGTDGGCDAGFKCALQQAPDKTGVGYACESDLSCSTATCTTVGECCPSLGEICGPSKTCITASCGQCGNPACGTCTHDGQCGSDSTSTDCGDGEVCSSGFCSSEPVLLDAFGCNSTYVSCTPGLCGSTDPAAECPDKTICGPTGTACITPPCGTCGYTCDSLVYDGPKMRPEDLITGLYKILYPSTIVLATYYLSTALYALMTSAGNPQKKLMATDRLVKVVTGSIFAIASLVFLRIILNTLVIAMPVF